VTNEQVALAAHMIAELEHPSKPLTTWEESFVESVTDQWERRHWLSDRQLEILERIYAEKTD
jgi:hypothetical protein